MTNETAFNTIVTILSLNLVSVKLNSDIRQALTVAVSALEKQIPKKPIIEHYRYYDKYSCPKCNRYFLCKDDIGFYAGDRSEFCDKCGKAIDWSDEK